MPLKFLKYLLSLGANVITVVLILMVLSVTTSGGRFWTGLRTMLFAPPPVAQVDVRSTVLQQVRGASELTTAVFGMESVVPTHRDRQIGGYTIGQTTLLYIAYGEVRAGVDLSQLRADDVTLTGDAIAIQLPPPQILDSKIDVTRSQVYDYDRGFLALGPDAAPELQTLAQQQSLAKMIEAACQQDILAKANSKAELVVTQLLTTAGYSNISVQSRSPAEPSCAAAAIAVAPVDPPAPTAAPTPLSQLDMAQPESESESE